MTTASTARVPHIILVGLPGAGKTVCGALLATRLARPFLDLDLEIERTTGRTIREIFEVSGEPAFRTLETRVTESLSLASSSVVSPGGGWIERDRNRDLVRGIGRIVYLRVSPGVALRRLGQQTATRPLLAGEDPLGRLTALLDRRAPFYRAADEEVDTEVLSPEAVVDQLVRLALRWGGPVG